MSPLTSSLHRLVLVAGLAVALIIVLLTPAVAGSPEERRLAETRQKLDRVQAEIEAASGERTESASSLAEAEGQLATVLEALTAAELSVQRQQEQVESARTELRRLEDAQAIQQQLMGRRAVALYTQGTNASVATILSADSTEEALQRSTYVEVLSRADRAAFEGVEIAQVATDAQRQTLEAEEATLARVAEQQREIVEQVRGLRDERALVLAGSEEKLAELQSQERHLESESREIAALARRASRAEASARAAAPAPPPAARQTAGMQAAPATGSPAASDAAEGGASTPSAAPAPAAAAPVPAPASGGWVWPAAGSVTSEYGQRWGRMHEGIDIGASTGAPVVAARGGRVAFAGRMGGYGNFVLVDHGGGAVSAYAHMSALSASEGQSVSAGQRIGSIGCTGSCTGPHLHFEIRINGAARDPRNFLG
jgi:septal ring factor EnvC (AmiA/AmiB activator)